MLKNRILRNPGLNLVAFFVALGWTSSTTHYRPFYDQDSTKYTHVGFGIAKAKSGIYYGCSIFSNP